MYGYFGTILKVNLSSGEVVRESFDEEFARTYLGGNGFAAKIIYDAVPPDADPLSADNVIVFALGPFNGSPVWGSSRGQIAAISPQTGFFADSNFGGDFTAMLKKTGVDAVAISGKAESPVYLMLDGDDVSIKAAGDIWGKSTTETQAALLEKEGKGVESASIGPAGENGVLYACIMGSGKRVSAAGRGGLGAVMGSKNLKALAARGDRKPEMAEPEKLKESLRSRFPILRDNTKAFTSIGTPILVNMINGQGKLGTHNNTRETFDLAEDISGELIEKEYKEKNTACARCPVACGKLVKVPHGEFAGQSVKMLEYESIYSLGSMLDNNDLVSLFNANTMCDEMGMDTVSMGVTLSFVAECLEKGIVTEEELGGTVPFGKGERIPELIRLTGLKEGIGELLALGSERLAQRWGKESWKLLYSVKGLEIAGHSARGIRSLALGYATSTRGGSHHDARPDYIEPDGDPGFEGQAERCFLSQNNTAFGDSLVVCRFIQERGFGSGFGGLMTDSIEEVLQHVTGWDIELVEIRKIGERIYNLERQINVERGLDRSKDTVPYRVTHEPIPEGPSKGRFCPEDTFQKLLDEYYQIRGWDSQGRPGSEKLAELRLTRKAD